MFIETRDSQKLKVTLSGDPTSPHRVALIHSLAMDHRFWEPVAREIANEAHVLAYDCRGHGESGHAPGPYTVSQFADDLADVLDQIGWEKAIVAGASMGGTVALAFATAYPHRTLGLGLFDTTAWYGADAPARWQERANKAKADGLEALVDFQTTRWFSDSFREQNPEIAADCVATFLRNDISAYVETCLMLGRADLRKGLSSLTMPTRIAVGQEDYATPVAMAQDLCHGVRRSTLTILEGVRHLTPLEVPNQIADELRILWMND